MSASVEALYIFEENNNCILEHIYTSRPPLSKDLISRLQAHPNPRPSILYLNDLSPPSTVYSITHANLLFVCTSSRDAQSLVILEFLYKVVDVFEDFLGSPLLGSKIEENYEVVAQLIGEMCDGGIISNTESNALKEQVEVSTLMGKLFTQVGLPGSSPALGPSNLAATLKASSTQSNGPAIPWRRSNVRHTSNELYVDIVESVSVIYAPSGRPISARVSGSIAFTAKISGVPELTMTLSAPGGTSNTKSAGISRTMELPVFHPCVRLARWKEAPGELSFVPPDGRFMLAGYETNLLPFTLNNDEPPSRSERIFLPAIIDLRTGLGSTASDFEARLTLNTNFPGVASTSKPAQSARGPSGATPFSFGNVGGGTTTGSSSAPSLESVIVSIPFPSSIRTVTELKPSRGEANYNTVTKSIEWKVSTKDGATVNGVATLTGSVLGSISSNIESDHDIDISAQAKSKILAGYYDEDTMTSELDHSTDTRNGNISSSSTKRNQVNKALMPRSIAVSFSVKGWLASGIKVESLNVDIKRSKGLGDGVKPYKGVKYLTVSKSGVERRVA